MHCNNVVLLNQRNTRWSLSAGSSFIEMKLGSTNFPVPRGSK